MKKYFVVETDEICKFGDVLNLTFFKDLEDGKVTVNKKVVFSEATIDWMIEMGFVEEREIEEENANSLLDFGEPCETLSGLIKDFETLEDRVEKMEDMIKEIYHLIKEEVKPKKENNTQPKKK